MLLHSALWWLCFLIHGVFSDGNNPMSAPKAGEIVQAEKPYTIRWWPGTQGPVKIGLFFGDNTPVPITDSTPNNGTYTWVPSGVYSGKDNYFMVICALGTQPLDCTYTFNGRFTIASSGSSVSLSVSSSTSIISRTSSILDFPSPSSSPTGFSSSSSSTESIASPTASNSLPNTTTAPTRGLSLRAKTAISVIFGLIGIALITLGAFFWGRGRKRQEQVLETTAIGDGSIRVELPVGTKPMELSSQRPPVELPANSHSLGYC